MSWATSLIGSVGAGLGALGKGFAGGFGEGAGIKGLATKFGENVGVTGGWADVGRQIGQVYGRTQSSQPLATTMRTWEGFQQSPTFKNLLTQLATQGMPPVKGKRKAPKTLFETERRQGGGWGQADIGMEED